MCWFELPSLDWMREGICGDSQKHSADSILCHFREFWLWVCPLFSQSLRLAAQTQLSSQNSESLTRHLPFHP